jgi:hypothetical protein
MEHRVMMLTAMLLITIGSANAKCNGTDKETHRTVGFSIGLLIILITIPSGVLTTCKSPLLEIILIWEQAGQSLSGSVLLLTVKYSPIWNVIKFDQIVRIVPLPNLFTWAKLLTPLHSFSQTLSLKKLHFCL